MDIQIPNIYKQHPLYKKIKKNNFVYTICLYSEFNTYFLKINHTLKNITYVVTHKAYNHLIKNYTNIVPENTILYLIKINYLILLKKKIKIMINTKILLNTQRKLQIELIKKPLNNTNCTIKNKIISFLKQRTNIHFVSIIPNFVKYKGTFFSFLNGKKTIMEFTDITILSSSQHKNLKIITHHNNNNTLSLVTNKSIVGGSFNLNIKDIIKNNMINAKVKQQSNSIILSANTVIQIKPQMEIYSNNINCKHGVTISNFQKEEFLYLNTRGLNTELAYMLLIISFIKILLRNLKINTYTTYKLIKNKLLHILILPQAGLEPAQKLFFEEF